MSKRLIVFVDYQNAYRGARAAFHDHDADPHYFGQFDPLKLGLHLAADSHEPRELVEVRVYRGMPVGKHDAKGYAAARRQVATWDKDVRTRAITRPIRYPEHWPYCSEKPQEKGIDVALALDFAVLGHEKRYDVGMIFSADTDLKPALEYIADKRRAWGSPIPEVVAWSRDVGHSKRLSLQGERSVYCHWLNKSVYTKIQDERDYTKAT